MTMDVAVDEKLLDEVAQLARNGNGAEIIGAALDEHIRHSDRLKILDLEGKIEYYEDYDYKAGRRKR